MNEQLIPIGKIVATSLLCPMIVSFICTKIQCRRSLRLERQKEAPVMYILELNNESKVGLNKKDIDRGGDIIQIYYSNYVEIEDAEATGSIRRTIRYKRLKYKELQELAAKKQLYFIGFNKLQENNTSLKTIVSRQGYYDEIDVNEVPVFLSRESRYSFVFEKNDMPLAIQGRYLGKNISYEIESRKDDNILPIIENQ